MKKKSSAMKKKDSKYERITGKAHFGWDILLGKVPFKLIPKR